MTSPLLCDHADNPAAILLLAHGAGAPMDSEFMARLAAGLAARGISVARFEFPYMARRRAESVKAPPDRAPQLLAHFETMIGQVAELAPSLPLWVGGKSMGGRMATMISAQAGEVGDALAGCVVFGYPFHPPGKPDKTRLDHFPSLRVPVLICQGERDPFGKPDEVCAYPLPNAVSLEWIADGDHDFKPRKRSGRDRDANLRQAAARTATFMGL